MNSKPTNIFISDKNEQQEHNNNSQQQQQNHPTITKTSNKHHQLNNQQLDKLLDDEIQEKQEIVLRFKLNQLQKICNSLTKTNNKLIEKVTTLEEEKQMYWGNCSREDGDRSGKVEERREGGETENIYVDQYSQLNNQFSDLEEVIQEYKTELEHFRKTTLVQIKNKDQKVSKYKSESKELNEKCKILQLEKQDIEKLNKQLETRNEGLILQIQNLQKQRSKLQQKLQSVLQRQQFAYTNPTQNTQNRYQLHSHTHSNQSQYELPIQIQSQYELLIDRLVKQLEYEKNIKKKMSEEIKRMSQELMQSERQIMSKNKKLYEIQMKLLRSSKATADTSVNYSKIKIQDNTHTRLQLNSRYDNLQRYSNNGSGNGSGQGVNNGLKNEKSDAKLGFKPFVILELINGELQEEISNPERKVIGMKIIQFYQRKMQREDFSNVNPENLLVWNFNHKKPQLCSIRKVGTSAYEEGEKTEQSLVWNLAFILDNLFSQNQGIQDFDEILEITGQVLEKQLENNKQAIQCMKQILCL